MPSVTIDAGVLAVPPADSSADAAYRYVDTLLDWRELLDKHKRWVAVYMSARASDALVADGLFPLRDSLRDLFKANGIREYDVNTVVRVVETLLELTPSFEERFGVSDVLIDSPLPLTDPDILGLATGNELQWDLARCLILIAILRQHCEDTVRNHFLIVRYAQEPAVTVQAKIQMIEPERDDLDELPTCPEVFKGNVLVCDDFRGFIQCLDESSILVDSKDSISLETAIRIALYKSRLGQGEAPAWDNPRDLRIGRHFIDTVRNRCMHQGDSFPAKVLRAIVQTLDKENMPAVHPIRTDSGGGAPQKTRKADGADAWRRDIDLDHHLHYWSCHNGIVELASISYPHDDFSIPE